MNQCPPPLPRRARCVVYMVTVMDGPPSPTTPQIDWLGSAADTAGITKRLSWSFTTSLLERTTSADHGQLFIDSTIVAIFVFFTTFSLAQNGLFNPLEVLLLLRVAGMEFQFAAAATYSFTGLNYLISGIW
ncbi:hypothetical protein J6590_022533 [Homalodisca vitripennis]|nr:hypothetical protein J6590_022533 [Homalodisca vitripennis]